MQQPHSVQPGWRVLLIGGNAGAGKTLVARAIASLSGHALLQAEDFRLVIQHMTTPAEQPGIHYFLVHPTIWQKPPEAICDGMITVGNALARPLSVVIAHHALVENAGPIVLEGEGILPALAAQRTFSNQEFASATLTNEVRAVFLVEPDEEVILRTMRQRRPDFERISPKEQESLVRANWLYGQWLRRQADHYRLPVVISRPWDTLLERVVRTLGD